MIELQIDEQTPSYAVGDVPSEPLAFTLDDDVPGDWTGVESSVGDATLEGDTIELTLPALDVPGILSVVLTLTGDGGERATIAPIRIVVEDPEDGWLTLDQARYEWVDAPAEDPVLYSLLRSARDACETFAPAVEVVPEHYRRAQLLQAIGVWNSSRSTTDRQGAGDFAVTVYPLDWNVKQLLRPKAGVRGMW